MKKKTSRYIILLIISSLSLSLPLPAQVANPKPEVKKQNEEEKAPLYNGASVSLDLYGLGSKLLGGDFLSTEISMDVNLKHRFFPAIELGYGTTDTTDDDNNIHYKSSGAYGRIGVNYNTMSKKKSESFLYVGLRYGFATFKYDVQAPSMEDPIWGGSVPFDFQGIKSNAHWMEFLVGVKAQVYKNFQMGWALRYKARINAKNSLNSDPWYIPGFGSNKSSTFGVTYNLIYKLPF